MATAIETGAALRLQTPPEQRIVLRGVSWETYQRLVEEVGDSHVLMAYNRGVLEFMSPGPLHEKLKKRIDRLVGVVTEELGIPCLGMSSTRWPCTEAGRGVEADECYMLTAEKVAASDHDSPDAEAYPAPDLAIEIDMRNSEVDRPEIYATLGVPEVWRFDGVSLAIDRLREDGVYEPATESRFLPITPSEVVRWVYHPETRNETVWARQLRVWVRAEVLPRRAGNV